MAHNRSDRDVYVVKVGSEYRVRPAVAAVKGRTAGVKGTVTFRNTTDDPITVIFPANTMENGADSQNIGRKLDATFTLEHVVDVKTVSYMVIVSRGTELIPAKGESEPVLIIDP